jgi:hypothetical protein
MRTAALKTVIQNRLHLRKARHLRIEFNELLSGQRAPALGRRGADGVAAEKRPSPIDNPIVSSDPDTA